MDTDSSERINRQQKTSIVLPLLGILFRRCQCLVDIRQDIVDVLNADGQPDHLFTDAG